MFRFVNVLLRKRRLSKESIRQVRLFTLHKQIIQELPAYEKSNQKLLLIRLDDIGDYLLFRNTLPAYKSSPRWQHYKITLLGNIAWKELFDHLDKQTTDETIWINKKDYYEKEAYRKAIWHQLNKEGFTVVICASATRPLLLDDVCRMATGAPIAIAFSNLTPHKVWKQQSDALYTELFTPSKIEHEFLLNQHFASWCCGIFLHLQKPTINVPDATKREDLVCFIGASTKSRRWPMQRWIELISLIKNDVSLPIKIIGVAQHKNDAEAISAATNAQSITNTHLADMIAIMANAKVVISNDTMAAHLGVSCGAPVVIISSGNNFTRFTIYEEAGVANVRTLYPFLVQKKRKQYGDDALHEHIVVTSDIASIKAPEVYKAVKQFL